MDLRKTLVALSIISFVLAGATGVAYSGMLMEHGDMGMFGCPLMNHSAAVCTMNPLEHLGAWQSMFAAIPQQGLGELLTLLLLSILAVVWVRFRPPALRVELKHINPAQSANVSFFRPLQELFSNGILNPKVF